MYIMSFDTEFANGLSSNFSRFTTVGLERAARAALAISENASLNALNVKYGSLVADKIAQNASIDSQNTADQVRITDIKSKITAIQNLSTAEKATLYQVWTVTNLDKRSYMNIVIDRYATIISRADTIIADNALSTQSRDMLLNLVVRDENQLQIQNITTPPLNLVAVFDV